MSEEKALVNWKEQMKQKAVAIAKLERPQIGGVSLRGGQITVNGNQVPGNKLNCIIISSAHERVYYSGAYDPDNQVSPDCFALSLTGEDMAPHEAAQDKQNHDCATCPKNKWGSAMRNGRPSKGKACGEKRRLLIMPIPEDAEAAKKAEVALVRIPVTSVNNWRNYANTVATLYEMPPMGVITELSTKPDVKTQFQVLFDAKGLLADEIAAVIFEREPKLEDILMQPYEPNQEENTPAPAASGKKAKY